MLANDRSSVIGCSVFGSVSSYGFDSTVPAVIKSLLFDHVHTDLFELP